MGNAVRKSNNQGTKNDEAKDIVINGTTVLKVVKNDKKEQIIEDAFEIIEEASENRDEYIDKDMQDFFKIEEQKNKEKKFLSLDEKIQKIKELGILTERRNNLFESKNKLSEFAVGTTSEGQKLELIDSNKRAFNISNTEAIKGVIDYLKSFLDYKIQDVEKQITFE